MSRTTAVRRALTVVCFSLLFTACTKPPGLLDQARNDYLHQHYTLAFKKTLRLAKLCNPAAQYALGNMYFYGTGTVKDQDLARYWIERAARKGYCPAVKALHIITKERYDQYAPIEPINGKSLHVGNRVPERVHPKRPGRPCSKHCAASQTKPLSSQRPPRMVAVKSSQMSGAGSPKQARQRFAQQRMITLSAPPVLRRVLHNGKYVTRAVTDRQEIAAADVSRQAAPQVDSSRKGTNLPLPNSGSLAKVGAKKTLPISAGLVNSASSLSSGGQQTVTAAHTKTNQHSSDTMWSRWENDTQHHFQHSIRRHATAPKVTLAQKKQLQHVAHAHQAGHHHDSGFHWPWQHRSHPQTLSTPQNSSSTRIATHADQHSVKGPSAQKRLHRTSATNLPKLTSQSDEKNTHLPRHHVDKQARHAIASKTSAVDDIKKNNKVAHNTSHESWFHLPHIHFDLGHKAHSNVSDQSPEHQQSTQHVLKSVHPASKNHSKHASHQVHHHTLDAWGKRSGKSQVASQKQHAKLQAGRASHSKHQAKPALKATSKAHHVASENPVKVRSHVVQSRKSSTLHDKKINRSVAHTPGTRAGDHQHHVQRLQAQQHGWLYRMTHHQTAQNSAHNPQQHLHARGNQAQQSTLPKPFDTKPVKAVKQIAENDRLTIKPLALHSGPSLVLRKPGKHSTVQPHSLNKAPRRQVGKTKVVTRSLETHHRMRSAHRAAKDAERVKANREKYAWTAKQNPNDFTVQLTVTSKLQKIKPLAKMNLQGHSVVPYQFHLDKQVKYAAVCGSFKNAEAAEKFQASLPKKFSKYAHVFQWKVLRKTMEPYS